MKKAILILIGWTLPFLLLAQNNASMQSIPTKEGTRMEKGKGIKWTTGLSWEQIKQKAKNENKYIFIDAYTTWCGPCKMMDKYVYPNDTVGDFFNQYFIAVKAQMDKTDKDEETIKDWYNDARSIEGDYSVIAYPSLIFLSPQSTILYKMEGFRSVQKFVDTARLVLTNGTVFNDPFKEYRALVKEYKQGKKQYNRIPYMINTAFVLHDDDLAREMFKDHLKYVSTLNENERYTKGNIELWSSVNLKPDSKVLQFFLKDYSKIDQVMGQKGWASNVVNTTIQARIVDSFFRMQKGVTTTTAGNKISNSEIMFIKMPLRKDGKIEPDYVEADWKKLKNMVSKYFNKDYTSKNVILAKMRWYYQHQNKINYVKTYFSQLEKYPPTDLVKEAGLINQIAWETFLYVNNKKLLNKALAWMSRVILQESPVAGNLDTYANLLYKLGRIKEAIEWEEKAAKLGGNKSKYWKIVEQIKRGEPTYLDQGAIWTKE